MLGSGEPDFGAGFAADYRAFDRLMFYFNFNLVYPVGPITNDDLTLNPLVTESLAIHFGLTRYFSLMLHQATYTSPFHGTHTQLLDGTTVELGFGMSFAYNPWVSAQVLGIQNLSWRRAVGGLLAARQPGLPAVGASRAALPPVGEGRHRFRCRRSASRCRADGDGVRRTVADADG